MCVEHLIRKLTGKLMAKARSRVSRSRSRRDLSASPRTEAAEHSLVSAGSPAAPRIGMFTISNRLCCIVYIAACWWLVAEPGAYKPPMVLQLLRPVPGLSSLTLGRQVDNMHNVSSNSSSQGPRQTQPVVNLPYPLQKAGTLLGSLDTCPQHCRLVWCRRGRLWPTCFSCLKGLPLAEAAARPRHHCAAAARAGQPLHSSRQPPTQQAQGPPGPAQRSETHLACRHTWPVPDIQYSCSVILCYGRDFFCALF
ncbi:hypothetical protein COO60DRAFT_50680 [Scenedesmus sp. NREL 46B-D3]|nr:hypothetical protein COO60DRAFT_50680 [Scenedesmus sp. NREL 46B-D3]